MYGIIFYIILTPSRLLHDAARVGNDEFLIILIRSYPDLLWETDDEDKSIFHVAVENRQASVFSLIYELGGQKDLFFNYHSKDKENMLNLAATLASPNDSRRVPGAAFQMHRELLWFKEVEKIILSSNHGMISTPIREPSQVKLIGASNDIQKQFEEVLKSGEEWMKTNKARPWILMAIPELSEVKVARDPVDKLTPRELFTKEQKELLKSGEKWMKTAANSCMVVATLIATVVFAAAFTVPGGNNKEGLPIFRENEMLTVFLAADGAALGFSIISILTFLSILTSRFAEDDFLVSLPRKLAIGILTLSYSMGFMVIAFVSTFFILYDKTKAKIMYVIGVAILSLHSYIYAFFSRLLFNITLPTKSKLRRPKKRLF